MRGRWLNRALLVAAGVVVSLTTATAPALADSTAPASRFAGLYEAVVLLPESAAAQNVLSNPLNEVTATYAYSDSFALETAVNADVGRMLDHYTSGTDGLFYSASSLGSFYTGLASGGLYSGLRVKLTEGLEMTIGQAATQPGYNRYLVNPLHAYEAVAGGRVPTDLRYTKSVLASMTWNFTRWAGVNFSAAQIVENNGALGVSNPILGRARTSSLGVNARVSFGGGWVTTASYSEGLTQLALRPGALAPSTSVRTESFGVAVAKHGLFNKSDSLGVAFAQPAPNLANLPTAERSSDLQFFGRDRLLSTMAKETDIELGYKTEFFGNSVALQANASYQMNYGGVTGREAVSLLSKAKIKF